METSPLPAVTAATADDASTIIAADRWRLWSTLVRGLCHQLANASQMLTLEPVPRGALEEARERIAQGMLVMSAFRSPGGPSPTLLPAVLEDLDRLQRLQMDYPSTPLPVKITPALPALDAPAEDLAHLLLGMVTLLKHGAGDRRAELAVTASACDEGGEIVMTERMSPLEPVPSPALLALATLLHARLERAPGGASLRLWLPAWKSDR